jgi:2-methylisocitrate lyase-like PEP mutase family enzyme
MADQASLSKRLRDLFQRRSATLVPGASNALAARIAEDVGFEAVYVTGAGVTNSYLGAPDLGLLTLTELAQHVATMREAVSVPLIVDADTGFGNAINVGRTVRVLERAGANAIQLEDQEFPKKCGHFTGKAVIPAAEMAMKIRAAIDARVDRNFQIVARTDAIACNGIEDALERAMMFVDAGADVIFVEAPTSLEDMERIARIIPVPQIINLVAGGMTPMADIEHLRSMRFSVVLYANAALQAAMHAMHQILTHLHSTGSLEGANDLLVDFRERQRMVGKSRYDEQERRYAIADGSAGGTTESLLKQQ